MAIQSDFDFQEWIIQYQLNDIKQCLINHNMSTLSTCITLYELYQINVWPDIIKNAHLIQNLRSGIQSLDKHKNHKSIEIRYVFTTQKENEIFCNLERYINHLNDLQQEFQTSITNEVNQRKQQNTTAIQQYQTKTASKLNEIRNEINNTINKLHDILTKNEQEIQDEIDKYKQDIQIVNKSHLLSMKHINKYNWYIIKYNWSRYKIFKIW